MEMVSENIINSPQISQKLYFWERVSGGWLVVLFGLLTIAFIFVQVFKWGEEKQITLLSDSIQALISLASVFLAWRVTTHPAIEGQTLKAWKRVFYAFSSYSAGHCLWFVYLAILEIEPFPSWVDVGFLGFYPLMLWALLSFPTVKRQPSDLLKLSLDIAIIMLGGSIAIWNFIVRPTLESSIPDARLTTILNLAYIVGDLVIFFGISKVMLSRPIESVHHALRILVFGLLNLFAADVGFAYLTLQLTVYSGYLRNLFVTGMLTLMIASYYQYKQLSKQTAVEETEKETKAEGINWLPYLGITLGFGILLIETHPFWGEWLGVIIFSSLILTGLIVLRQFVAVQENINLLSEKAEQQNELRFRTFLENSTDLISVLDFEGHEIFRSPSVGKILGYDESELNSITRLELVHDEDLEEFKSWLHLLETSELEMVKHIYRGRCKDGTYRVFEGVAKQISDENLNLQGILINARDITERTDYEEKLRLYMQKLEKSNRELQDFAHVASHDLQEPLRKVQAFGDRLHRKYTEKLGEEGGDYVRRMREASGRMQTLINDLLIFSRVSSKAQPFQSVKIKNIAQEVVSDLEVRIEETKGKVEIGELPEIDADPIQMRQLMQNLIGNALKFHQPNGNPVIKVYSKNVQNNGGNFSLNSEDLQTQGVGEKYCQIAVQDNGIGFDEKYLDRIFTVFQRLHGRTEYEGSGIGLAVCRKIVERHGGSITAQSKEGEGATFLITLPVNQIHQELSQK